MQDILSLYKEVGETPLQRVERFRELHPEYCWEKMTYAGRLDPLAEGVLLVLSGPKCKERNGFLALSKEYEFDIIFGVETDTYDILGKIVSKDKDKEINADEIEKKLSQFKGKIKQKYPPYSSKTVQGKALFEWAKEGRLNEIEIPKNEVEIYDISVIEDFKISGDDVLKKIKNAFSTLDGDFRQDEILKSWRENVREQEEFFVLKMKTKCSSGTYVRGIVHDISEMLEVPACVFGIKRNKIGEFKIEDSVK